MTESLLKEAQAIGAKSLVLCPLNDGSEVPASETLSALRDLAPLFAFYGIHGLGWSRWASRKARCVRHSGRRR